LAKYTKINYLAEIGRGIVAKKFSYISLQAAGNMTPRSRQASLVGISST